MSASDPEERVDLPGCVFWGMRFAGCSLLLYILMFLAIFAVALISLLFF